MAAGNIISIPTDGAVEVVEALGSIGKWLQAIGLVVIIWIAVQLINWIYNRRRLKRLDKLIDRLDKIEKKINKLMKKK